jgi:hypothetical protein
VGHLETEFLYNFIPTDERKAALSSFTGIDIYAVDDWFKQKAAFIPVQMSGRL